MRILLYALCGLLLAATMGCAGRITAPSPSSDPAPRGQGTVDAEAYHTVEELLEGNAVQLWSTLSEDTQRRVWGALVDGVPYPPGTVQLQQMSQLDSRVRSQPAAGAAAERAPEVRNIQAAGLAWLPATPSLAAAVATESRVGPALPERIHNVVAGEGVSSQQLSMALGFDVTETFAPPQIGPQPVPTNTQVALVPVVLYHASMFEVWDTPRLGNARQVGTGQGYQYAGIALFSFVIEP
jgi:hypothetical protein